MRQSYTLSELHMKRCILPGRQKCSNTIPDTLPPKLPECRYICYRLIVWVLGLGMIRTKNMITLEAAFFLQKSPTTWRDASLIPGSSFRGAEMDGSWGADNTPSLRVSTQHPNWKMLDLPEVFSQELFGVPANLLTPVSSTFMFRDLSATVNTAPLKNGRLEALKKSSQLKSTIIFIFQTSSFWGVPWQLFQGVFSHFYRSDLQKRTTSDIQLGR